MKFDAAIFTPADPWFIAETRSGYLVLNFDQTYVGRCILVPKAASPDMESLADEDIAPLMLDVVEIARLIKQEFGAARMNYASLGNVVDQLHWHIIPRYDGDLNWGAPPWPVTTPRSPSDEERSSIIARIRQSLAGAAAPCR